MLKNCFDVTKKLILSPCCRAKQQAIAPVIYEKNGKSAESELKDN